MKRVLVACDKFKGSLSAIEACEAVAAGLPRGWEAELCPIADGGEGFVESMLAAGGGRRIGAPCHDALGRPVEGGYGLVDRLAVIEMAEASGMWRLGEGERDPRRATTRGTGELMRHAVEVSGARGLLVGLGGSATNDAGAGMAAALGVRFVGADGGELAAHPEGLAGLARIDEAGRLALPAVRVACDVDNPLLGARGASAVFGPQKGAGPEDVAFLDGVLSRRVEVGGYAGLASRAGAGAAGGLGFGLMAWAGGVLEPGFGMVAEAIGLERRIAAADLVITGEGSLDAQTLGGKGPAGVARLARRLGVPVWAVAGRVEPEAAGLFERVFALEEFGLSVAESMARAGELVERMVGERMGG